MSKKEINKQNADRRMELYDDYADYVPPKKSKKPKKGK